MTRLQKTQFISSFILKVVAILTMTIDHIGFVLNSYYPFSDPRVEACRIIGRIALPLFCLGIAEGVMHTKHFGKYILRLGIMVTVVAIGLAFLWIFNFDSPQGIASLGNIFMDLSLGALIVYLLRRKKWYLKLLAILPIAVAVASDCCTTFEYNTGAAIYWFPCFLRTQYGVYGVALIVLFYFAYWAVDVVTQAYASNSGLDRDTLFAGGSLRLITNVSLVLVLAFCTFMFWLKDRQFGGIYLDLQPYALLAGALLLFYNGKRGYNNKVIQYGFYVYYPLHIIVLAIIYYFMNF